MLQRPDAIWQAGVRRRTSPTLRTTTSSGRERRSRRASGAASRASVKGMARGRLIVLLAGLAVCGAVACGSQSTAPLGKGDTVYVDVEASTLPDQPDAYLAD